MAIFYIWCCTSVKKYGIMTDQEKIQKLKHAFEETIWMAIRYAELDIKNELT